MTGESGRQSSTLHYSRYYKHVKWKNLVTLSCENVVFSLNASEVIHNCAFNACKQYIIGTTILIGYHDIHRVAIVVPSNRDYEAAALALPHVITAQMQGM